MPIPKSIEDTWTWTDDNGTEFTLGPVTPRIAAQASDMIRADRYSEGMWVLVEGGGVRGWKTASETVARAQPADLLRLTPTEVRDVGGEVFRRTFMTPEESD